MTSSPSTRRFALVAVVVCLALAGGVSYYASSRPDGLNRVAADAGFDRHEEASAAEDSPLAGYRTSGVESDRMSGGLAGVLGVAVVLLATGGLVYAVRRGGRATGDRVTDQASRSDQRTPADPAGS